ncbi:MAG TPA: winged helix-turn-helix domain-containing protein [Blastocatellia bacterium]|nr:winged helix-turn-helix domain-containing protein [Blastocatellia bacterium]
MIGFHNSDRRRLAKALKGATDLRAFRRIQAVLLVAAGEPVKQVAKIVGASQKVIYDWLHYYLHSHRVEDLHDAARSGRPAVAAAITPARIHRQLRRDPLKLGYKTTVWTVPLLATHLNRLYNCHITARTLRRRMKAAGLRWKRPRYVYATTDPNRAQKKGRSNGG